MIRRLARLAVPTLGEVLIAAAIAIAYVAWPRRR